MHRILLLILAMTVKPLPCIWLEQESRAAPFVTVEKTFAGPCIEGLTEV